jgi:hypothetical protein
LLGENLHIFFKINRRKLLHKFDFREVVFVWGKSSFFFINGQSLIHNKIEYQRNTVATTPIASPLILPDSLNQFLDLSQRRHSYSMVQIMSYEMMRLHSFKREFTVSAIKVFFCYRCCG